MSSSQLSEFYKQAKAEDETDIYDYDGVYDSMKASVSSTHPLPQAHESKDAPVSKLYRFITLWLMNQPLLSVESSIYKQLKSCSKTTRKRIRSSL